MLIGLTGKAGCGKSTCAEALVLRACFVEVSLAAPVKRAAALIWGFDEEQLFGASEHRNRPDPRWQKADGSYLTPREALQKLGTDYARTLVSDVWIRQALDTARVLEGDGHNVVIADVRFDDEAAAIRAVGGVIIHISRPAAEPRPKRWWRRITTDAWRKHASEAGVTPMPGDRQLHNTGVKEEAQQRIVDMVRSLRHISEQRCRADRLCKGC